MFSVCCEYQANKKQGNSFHKSKLVICKAWMAFIVYIRSEDEIEVDSKGRTERR